MKESVHYQLYLIKKQQIDMMKKKELFQLMFVTSEKMKMVDSKQIVKPEYLNQTISMKAYPLNADMIPYQLIMTMSIQKQSESDPSSLVMEKIHWNVKLKVQANLKVEFMEKKFVMIHEQVEM
ncbi:MAG: hypothetical protein EZS28_045176 [Streblomastix strix]|uniref:Uncharacterized protein n=1 Tax=Streblomastix strix TaxID=222440 RepID=A0A5J4TM43_9EUKA|nr:MAG: hypothetical protein EZS28_045176 [Streblomastix strix]